MGTGDYGERPFGLREVEITPSGGSAIELQAERVMSFTPRYDTGELEGADIIVEVAARMVGYDWEIEEGGVPLGLLKSILGGSLTSSGSTPNQVYYWDRAADDAVVYFKAQGRAIAEDAGDIEVTLYKCKVTSNPTVRLEKGAFVVSNLSGVGIADTASSNKFYTVKQKETAAAL